MKSVKHVISGPSSVVQKELATLAAAGCGCQCGCGSASGSGGGTGGGGGGGGVGDLISLLSLL
ncbi:MAG: hypothetical protein A2041_00560 [Bacteroidetes bacterium GWA2_31_9b]|nr:MAG: hypothetical protein A2041_00560 [Bacteroidetes bacterium GWA2_31_9b]